MSASEKSQAMAIVQNLYRRGKLEKMHAMLTRCQRHLFELATVQTSYNLRNLHDSSSQRMPINRFAGLSAEPATLILNSIRVKPTIRKME